MKLHGLAHPVRRNIALLLTHNALQNVLLIIPVIVPYYRDVLHLGFREFLLGEVAFSAVVVVMEVPAGWLADTRSRRFVLAAGSFAATIGFALLYIAHGFAGAVAGQATIGIGVSLINGTNSALLYDTLSAWRLQAKFRRLEGLRQATGFYTVGVSALVGGFLYAFDPHLPLAIDIATEAAAIGAALLMIEPRVHKVEGRRNPFRDIAATLHYVARGHREVGAIILFCGVMFGTTQAGFWSQQPYYIARGISTSWFGALAFVGFMLAGSASHHGHKLREAPQKMALTIMASGVAGSYLLAGALPYRGSISFLYASSLAYGFGMPLIQDALNARIDSSRRASILSTASLAGRLMFIPLGAAVAALSAGIGIDRTLCLMGLFLAVAGGSLAMNASRDRGA